MSREACVLPDVQAGRPDVQIGLDRVGVRDVKKLVKISRNGDKRPIILMSKFNVYVDLPAERKGIDMSRNMEVINEVVEELTHDPVYAVEDLCVEIAERLLERHDYTTKAEVEMEAEYMYRDRTPSTDMESQGTATIHASSTAKKDEDKIRKAIGADVTGTTACPCSQGMMESEAADKLRELGLEPDEIDEYFEEIPQAAHNQRSNALLVIETDRENHVGLEKIIGAARDSMSSRIYNLAKRPDEHHMTKEMHENARFVEDVMREMARNVVARFDLPDDAVIKMRQDNEESIHQHNAYSKTEMRFGDLKEQISYRNVAD